MEFIASCGGGIDSQYGEFFWRVDFQNTDLVPKMRAHIPLDYHMKYNDVDSARHVHYAGEVWEAADLMNAQLGDESVGEDLDEPATPISAFAMPTTESKGLTPHISIRTRQSSLLRRTKAAAKLSTALELGPPTQDPRTC